MGIITVLAVIIVNSNNATPHPTLEYISPIGPNNNAKINPQI